MESAAHAELEVLEGLHCASCVARLEGTLKRVPGVVGARVNLATRAAAIDYAPGATSPTTLIARMAEAGFVARERTDEPGTPARSGLGPSVAVALVLAAAVMSLAMLGPHAAWNAWAQGALTLALAARPARSILRAAATGLRRLRPDMDALVALGALSAFALSATLAARGEHHLYFESAAMILALVLLGRWLEERARSSAGAAVRALLSRRPPTAVILRAGHEEEQPLAAVRVGDLLRVRPGAAVPTDGVVVAGASEVDESLLSGESLPVAKRPGDQVLGGALNRAGSFDLRAERVGADTSIARMAELVRAAQAAKPAVARLADRVSAVFVPAVLALALITWIAWRLLAPDQPIAAVLAAASVLVIACPCALGLATPTAVMVAVGRAAELGLVLRDGQALEAMAGVDTVAFDKTGTLTEGRLRLAGIACADGLDELGALSLASRVEAGSEHPAAAAIRDEAIARGLAIPLIGDLHAIPGSGVERVVGERRLRIGTLDFVAEVAPRAQVEALAARLPSAASIAVLAEADRALAAFAFVDALRPGAIEAVASLRAAGLRVLLLSGDRREAVAAVARELAIEDFRAETPPAGKVAALAELQQRGHRVAMAGDGVNDAAALAQADVGIAVGAASDVARASGDVLAADPRAVAAFAALSRAAMRTIRQNLAAAFAYNLAAIPLAAGLLHPLTGWTLDPMVAAAAMAASSLTVVGNSLRLRQFRLRDADGSRAEKMN